MVCFQVVGNDTTIALATQAGQLELNVMMPVIAHNLLQSFEILTNATRPSPTAAYAGSPPTASARAGTSSRAWDSPPCSIR